MGLYMNAKEARALFIEGPNFKLEKDRSHSIEWIVTKAMVRSERFGQAKGYLECYEQMKVLVEALKEALKLHDKNFPHMKENCYLCPAEQALSQFRKAQGEK